MAVRGPKQYRLFGYFGCKVQVYCLLSCTIRKYLPLTVSGKRKVIKLCQLSKKPILIIFSLVKSTMDVRVGVSVAVGVLLGISVGVAVGTGVSDGKGVGRAVSVGWGVALDALAKDKLPPVPAEQAARIDDAHKKSIKRVKNEVYTCK